MASKALVQLVLETLSFSQKELAVRLGVSQTQISKWKKGEHMSHEMEEKLREIIDLGDKDPEFVLMAGSLQDANKWEKLIHYLAEMALENAETGYDTAPLSDELNLVCLNIFHTLKEMGVDLPKQFPKELDIDYESDDDDNGQVAILLEENPYSDLIYKIFISFNDVYGFYTAYIADLILDDELDLWNTAAENIEPCLLELAACKIEVNKELAGNFDEFSYRVMEDYKEWLTIVKDKAFRAGIPLRAELLELVYESHDGLGHQAEAESLGFNSSRVHPDIYMNELLCGMRTIHQVLPFIMKKLGIYDEFKLDRTDLQI